MQRPGAGAYRYAHVMAVRAVRPGGMWGAVAGDEVEEIVGAHIVEPSWL